MKVKDQIRLRREQLGVSVSELAKRLKVSAQAVRYWEAGRSFPGKAKTSALESALSFSIDWTEGARSDSKRLPAQSLIDPGDVELLLQIARLPPPAKALVASLVRMHLEAITGSRTAVPTRVRESSARPFLEYETTGGPGGSSSGQAARSAAPSAKRARGESSTGSRPSRRKAA